MADTSAIPDDRPLSPQEVSLVRWLLEHGSARAGMFLTQLAQARVVSRCYCGCASIDFSTGGTIPVAGEAIGILADYGYQSADGHLFGVFVFERAGLLAGLEVWSMDGQSTPVTLPQIEQLQPLCAGWPYSV